MKYPKQENIDKMKAFLKSIEPNSKGGAKGGARCASLPFDKLKEQWVEMEKIGRASCRERV